LRVRVWGEGFGVSAYRKHVAMCCPYHICTSAFVSVSVRPSFCLSIICLSVCVRACVHVRIYTHVYTYFYIYITPETSNRTQCIYTHVYTLYTYLSHTSACGCRGATGFGLRFQGLGPVVRVERQGVQASRVRMTWACGCMVWSLREGGAIEAPGVRGKR
jgi:hypothetical protein